MVKLIVFDFDGTILPYGSNAVSALIKKQLKTAAERGIFLAVSSGRTYGELHKYLEDFAEALYFICCDGAYYIKSGKILYGKRIEPQRLSPFFDAHRNAENAFVLHGANVNYAVGDLPCEADCFSPVRIEKLSDIKEDIFKITTYRFSQNFSQKTGLRTHWDGGANASAQYVNTFANKGAALSDLQMRLMLTKFDTACVGDSENDLAMFKGAKYTFAVGNRCNTLSHAATFVTDTAEEAFEHILTKI